jgi:alpha-N-arabinofuranosidase
MNKILLLLIFTMVVSCADEPVTIISVKNNELTTLHDDLFGHFIEKPSWHGEWGPEAALIPGTHQFQDGVEELMKGMNIPVLRFPGGTDVEFQDWTTMIDNVPGRTEGRPKYVGQKGDTVSNNFGYDEVCRLAERIGSEVIIVVNFGDAYFERKSLDDAILHETGLLAYLNLEVGADLPGGMPDWPSKRAENGRKEPYNVRYIQIANEPWVMDRDLKMDDEIALEKKEQYFKCLKAYVNAFKALDPDIEIIADGNCRELTDPLPSLFGDTIDYVAFHMYKPWGINEIYKNDVEIPLDSLTPEDAWKAWVSTPWIDSAGFSVIDNSLFKNAVETGYPIAVTEWNWNGWWGTNSVNQDMLGSHFTKGIGAAGFIHAMMRDAEHIALANQSMLVGRSWGITGIRVSETGDFEPHPYPTGEITGFYSRLHGEKMLEVDIKNVPVYQQPYKMNYITPSPKVAMLDVVASGSDDQVYIHIINRNFSGDEQVRIELSGFENLSTQGKLHTYTGSLTNIPVDAETGAYGKFDKKDIDVKRSVLTLSIPKRSVSVITIDKQ